MFAKEFVPRRLAEESWMEQDVVVFPRKVKNNVKPDKLGKEI